MSACNGNLVEKAGREGFRANRAYREFASMLENVFERLAIDFFRPTSQFGEEYNSLRAELNQEASSWRSGRSERSNAKESSRPS